VSAERVRELVPEAADTDDANLLARACAPVAKRRPGRDPGAQERRHRGELVFGAANRISVQDDFDVPLHDFS